MQAGSSPVCQGQPRESAKAFEDFSGSAAARSLVSRKHHADGEEVLRHRQDASQGSQIRSRELPAGMSNNDNSDRQGKAFLPDSIASIIEMDTPRILPPIAHLTNALDQNRNPQLIHRDSTAGDNGSNEWNGGGRFSNPLDSSSHMQPPAFGYPVRQSSHGYEGTSRDEILRASSADRNFRENKGEGYSGVQGATGIANPASQGRARSQIESEADWPSQLGSDKETLHFRRDMERIEDWASRIYYFATSAAPGTGNSAPPQLSAQHRSQRIPSERQFDVTLDQARNIVSILQMWKDQEYAVLDRSQMRPPEMSSLTRNSTSTTGGDAPARTGEDSSLESALPSLLSGTPYLTWDKNDEKAMKCRKRSAPKTPVAADHVATVSAPRAAPPGKCHSCNISETPEWRRGPDGARTLCNACGLHFAKLTKKKQQSLEQEAVIAGSCR